MPGKERIPASFWLKDKTVTGVLVADHAGKKLVSYNGKYFVVSDKTPEKRHYTESTLPASWKKMVAGETPPSPATPKAGKAVGKAIPVPGERGTASGTPGELPIPAAHPGKKRREEVSPEPAKTPKALPKEGKQKRTAAQDQTAEQMVEYLCPYCRTEHTCSVRKAGAPFFQQCSKCGKEFGVKVTARMVYQAEVAAFK